jgi:putative transcriptional regulator
MDGNLSNHFLIAAPGLQDEVFSKSVVYLYQQNEEGTVGFIVNKPIQVKAEHILPQLSINLDQRQMKDLPIFLGGPISPDQGLILYEKAFDQSEPQVMVSNKDELNVLPDSGKKFLVILGHSFWEPGELEAQIAHNDWLIAPFKRDIIFSKEIATKWNAALASIGVNISSFSEAGGHG